MKLFSSLIVDVIAIVCVVILFGINVTSADVDVDVALLEDRSTDYTFTPIDLDIDQSIINGIIIDLNCDWLDAGSSVPNTTFTIFPSNNDDGSGSNITVETSPPNLITVRRSLLFGYDGGIGNLDLLWNTIVSSTATSGGVRIGVPSDRLKRVLVISGHSVQIVDGFTNINYLSVDSGAILHASMTTLSDSREPYTDYYGTQFADKPKLTTNNYGGQMYVKTNVPVRRFDVSNGGQSWVETPSIPSVIVLGDGSELNIKGDVDVTSNWFNGNEEKVEDGAQLTVTGTIKGIVNNKNNSTVNAPSCDNVTSTTGSTCNAGPQSVDFDVGNLSQNSQILFGTYICSSSSLLFAQGGYYSIAFVMLAAVTAMLIS
jgi:hypothetical protein